MAFCCAFSWRSWKSVASLAANRLNVPQPTVSAALNRLRKAVGDPLMTRGRQAMVPTERAETMLIQAMALLAELDTMCRDESGEDGTASKHTFAIGTFDYIGPNFVPIVVNEVLRALPLAMVQVHQLSVGYDYMDALESGPLDLVIGNWDEPAPQLRHLNLFEDEIVCLVRNGHPLIRAGFDRAGYINAEHVGLIPYHVYRLGVIDAHLAKLGLKRNIRVVLPTFNGIANLVAHTDLVFTTGRRFAQGHAKGRSLRVLPAPIAFPEHPFPPALARTFPPRRRTQAGALQHRQSIEAKLHNTWSENSEIRMTPRGPEG